MLDLTKLVGQEFGALTVLGEGGRLGGYRSLRCRCLCDREAELVLHHVIAGKRRDCGCKYDFSQISQESVVGKRYGRLVVMAVGPLLIPGGREAVRPHVRRKDKFRFRTMSCQCDCGVQGDFNFNDLISGKIRSCGCSRPSEGLS